MKRIAGVLVALILAGLSFATTARAETIGDADRTAIQSLISGQIEAFRADNGAAAYAYASPTIQGYFPTADAFMAMVKQGYMPVYRPNSIAFGPLADSPIGPVQKVFVTGPDGRNYIAAYTMQQQPDGSWKINGCSLVEDDTPSI